MTVLQLLTGVCGYFLACFFFLFVVKYLFFSFLLFEFSVFVRAAKRVYSWIKREYNNERDDS